MVTGALMCICAAPCNTARLAFQRCSACYLCSCVRVCVPPLRLVLLHMIQSDSRCPCAETAQVLCLQYKRWRHALQQASAAEEYDILVTTSHLTADRCAAVWVMLGVSAAGAPHVVCCSGCRAEGEVHVFPNMCDVQVSAHCTLTVLL
jgi:hypothetical protein